MAKSSRRTLITEMPDLDSAYHDYDGVHIAHEMQDPETYVRNGKSPERRGFEVLEEGECAGNFDASGIPDTNTFAHGHVIRNYRGTLVDYAFGKAVDPCKGNSTGYMELFSYSKMIERVDPKKCPVLEARGDNELCINVLNGSKPYDGFKHAKHYKNIMKPIRVIEKAKYRKRNLRYKLVEREANFTADHVSHKGRSLAVNNDVVGNDEILENDWTLREFIRRDSPLGIGFCFFPDVKAATSKRHNLKKRVFRCVNCWEDKHTSKKCPYKKVSKSQRACFECGEPGHPARECKRKREESDSDDE